MTAALLFAGDLVADPGTQPATTAESPPPSAVLTPAQMKQRTLDLTEQQRQDNLRFQHLQAQARKQKDVIKLTCVNDRFIQFKAQSNEFDQAANELLAVLGDDRRIAAYERLAKAAYDAHATATDAQGCIGATEFTEGGTEFTAPEVADDPTKGLPFEIKIEPPAYASPFA